MAIRACSSKKKGKACTLRESKRQNFRIKEQKMPIKKKPGVTLQAAFSIDPSAGDTIGAEQADAIIAAIYA